jgi:hypothetical protein
MGLHSLFLSRIRVRLRNRFLLKSWSGSGSGSRRMRSPSAELYHPVLWIRIRDPALFYPPDPGSGMEQWSCPDPGSRTSQQNFVNSLHTKNRTDLGSGAVYPPDPGAGSGMEQWSDPDPESGIKHPGSATLVQSIIHPVI